jgi:hypothetical protein
MKKNVKVSADKSKAISEKLKKYEKINAASKNVLGGIGVAFPRLAGIVAQDSKE